MEDHIMSALMTAMKAGEIKSCYMGPAISPEQFIPEHFFLFLAKGVIEGYDGHKKYILRPGQYCLVRKNHLARYSKQKDKDGFEKIIVVFDQPFLKDFAKRYKHATQRSNPDTAFILLKKDALIPHFIHSLMPYYNEKGRIDEALAHVKREELLILLLQRNPELAGILFDFREPEKMDLEEFMNKNYKFNVSIQRFAYLTGRSLSAFKRDFAAIFGDTPSRWLIQRRLREAHFLIEKGNRPSDIYLDLGFEDLSHFTYVFRKKYGRAPGSIKGPSSSNDGSHPGKSRPPAVPGRR
ncbi:MAG TPA: AraC family transcriptional regulator [Puia sp.]|nr:AraC family transcriptional regulator [Puia sp.]